MARLERAVADLRTLLDRRFDAVDAEFAIVRLEIRDGDASIKSQLTLLIDSVRDDVRIFAEAHLALEQRVTRLEGHGR